MKEEIKFIFALQQIENIGNLIEGNQYEKFFISHLLPMKFEIERQISCLTGHNQSTTIKE